MLGASLGYNVPWKTRRHSEYFINADNVAYFCANALINLRPLNRLDYVTFLLTKMLVPLILKFGHTIERPTCARLAMEIGSYFRDVRYYNRARQFAELARYTLKGERKSVRVRTLLARLWQHDGIAAITEGNLKLANECFKKADGEITTDYSIGHANEALYEAQILLRSDPPQLEHIGEILRRYPRNTDPRFMTRWTSIELGLTKAQVEYQKNDPRRKRKAFAQIRDILDTIAKEGIVPTRAIFAPSLHAFADEYPSHKLEIYGLLRALPTEFEKAAIKIEKKLLELAKS